MGCFSTSTAPHFVIKMGRCSIRFVAKLCVNRIARQSAFDIMKGRTTLGISFAPGPR